MTGICATTPFVRLTPFIAAFSSSVAWAQDASNSCQIALGYSPIVVVPPPSTAVPGLTIAGIGLLTGLFVAVAWRNKHKGGFGRFMSIGLLAGVSMLSVCGGDALITAVRAAGPYEFSNAAGGSLTDTTITFASPAPLITVTNTSGARIKITSNGNSLETGTCAVGAELAAGGSCTTQAVCPIVTPVQIASEPTFTCDGTSPLDTYSWTYAANGTNTTIINYAPVTDAAPVFDPSPSGITTAFTYTRTATLPIYDPNGEVSNGAELGAGLITLTATAPQGYGFGADLASTKSWTSPYSCQSVYGGGGNGGGGNGGGGN